MNEDLRTKLLEMSAKDASVREELAKTGELFDGYALRMEAVHLENAAALEKMIDEHGWTGKSLVGADGAEAAWLIVQHAISLPEFSRKCLKLLEKAVAESEAEAWQAAYLQDRIAFFEGKPQKYGTQSDWNADGKMQVWTLENPEKVNEFRAEIGLRPLENLVWENAETSENAPLNYAERQQKADEWMKKSVGGIRNYEEKILIGGEWREAAESFAVKNPFTNAQIAEVFSIDESGLEEVIAAAEIGAKEMRNLARFEIAKGLRQIAEGIEKHKNQFAETIALESAKPIKYALGEVMRGIATFNFAAGEAEKFVGEVVAVDAFETGKGKTAYTKRIPRGVIYGITPFNFPLNLVAHKVAPALASGNAIIIKPSPRTPLTALLLGEVFYQTELPKTALQIAPMDTKYIEKIYTDERVKMISFTGSADVGWQIKSKANKKFVTLELGGNAPVIVDESADFSRSVERTALGAFSYSGQVCISVQRVYIHEKIFDDWTTNFIEKARNLKRGNPLDSETEISVMIDEKAAERAQNWVTEAAENGAEILCGNTREKSFLSATVVTKTNAEMRVVAEEIFAPVAVVEKFSDFEEAVSMANHSKFGLQAGVFTNDLRHAEFAAENLETGSVIINDVPTFRVDNMPYGGVKDSGFGREGVRYAMEEMSEIRLVVTNF